MAYESALEGLEDATETTRQELYDLVWAEPIKNVAPKLGVSDAALAKACRRGDIPVP